MHRSVLLLASLGLLGALTASPVMAASSSWQASLSGSPVRGRATLTLGHTTGSLTVHLTGLTPHSRAVVDVGPTPCGSGAQPLLTRRLAPAGADGAAAATLALSGVEAADVRSALNRNAGVSVLAVDAAGTSCGNLGGAPLISRRTVAGSVPSVRASYSIAYPQVGAIPTRAIGNLVNGAIRADVSAHVSAFKTEAIMSGRPQGGAAPSSLTGLYSVVDDSQDLLSLGELYVTYNTGAAHPLTILDTLNFDLTSGRLLRLADLFLPGSAYLATLSSESRRLLKAQLQDPSLNATIAAGTTPRAVNFGGWAIRPKGLRITFGDYQVGPYSLGMPMITIPWTHLRAILDPRGPVAHLAGLP